MRNFIDIVVEAQNPDIFWHGSPSGDLRGAHYGLHLGSLGAAREALESRIGVRADGKDWDGTTPYGDTLLAGRDSLTSLGRWATGFNTGLPQGDFYPEQRTYRAQYSNGDKVAFTARPSIDGYHIVGAMKNKPTRPVTDDGANRAMIRAIRNGTAIQGYYYVNDGEDAGSISVVVPNSTFIQKV